MGTVNSSPGRRATWYRARKPLPAMTVIVLLSVIAGLVWVGVLNRPAPSASSCQAAAAAGSSLSPPPITDSERLPPNALDTVAPVPPQLVAVQVLNANGKRGEGAIVAAELAELGFVPTAEPINDPLHPAFDLHCHGEIRFGPAGQAAARTLSLAVPCAELVRDDRLDEVIDLALGTQFTRPQPNDAAREILRRLIRLGQPVVGSSGGGQAAGLILPLIDPDLLRQARAVEC